MWLKINEIHEKRSDIQIVILITAMMTKRLNSGSHEVEKLVREHKENQRLLGNIPSRYYEIIYPVQLRHHEKVGISTRDVSANKTGKHFHHTALLIKAFSHKFRLDLELNTNLLAPNLIQKHFLPGDAQQITSQEIEHCYYHGMIKDVPEASAALRTCSGVSGVIHFHNETFAIHPFYGGDLSKRHPHVIYEVKNKVKHSCGNSKMHEWGFIHFRKPLNTKQRTKRDVREVTKYVELALILDKAVFDKRNGSSRTEVIQDAIQITNIVDLYFRTVKTRISIVYLETWANGNQIIISDDLRQTVLNFMDYSSRKLYKVAKDSAQLLTGQTFRGEEGGMASPDTICTHRAVGVSEDINIYEPHLAAVTLAHMIGHNMGMAHDDNHEKSDCVCTDWHGCIMAQSIVGLDNVWPYKFSQCSLKDYINILRIGHGICLFNKPNQLGDFYSCGNGIVEEGEDCDCGIMEECSHIDPCCDPITCKLLKEAECSTGPCCDKCKLRPPGFVCRPAQTECDIVEFCDGRMGQCPTDLHKKNGNKCDNGGGYCFYGSCPSMNTQCKFIWGYDGEVADRQCFEEFNNEGSFNGNCGTDINGSFRKCSKENIMCGTLQCQSGLRIPIIPGLDQKYSRTIVSIGGQDFECKVTSGTISPDIPNLGLVPDGTRCADDKVCINQTCLSVKLIEEGGRCPTNNIGLDCSGHGACSNINTCHCDEGWGNHDCSMRQNVTAIIPQYPVRPTRWYPPTPPAPYPITTTPPSKTSTEAASQQVTKSTKPYRSDERDSMSTVSLVVVLVSVVGGVFILFALMAVCYRRSSLPKYDPPYVKKPMVRKIPAKVGSKEDESSVENVNRIITFGNMPSYREDKLQELKRQRLKREKVDGDDECDIEDETVRFIELPPNNLSKLPEKGILKNVPRPTSEKEKWSDELSQSDNQEVMSQSEAGAEQGATDTLTEVERTLKSLNGYHEDILEVLRSAASHRGSASGLSQASFAEEVRKSLSDGFPEFGGLRKSSTEKLTDSLEHMEDTVPPCGPIRIRNLEDLIRQLERHPSRHMSPAGSEEIRLSETEADRHYRLQDSASATEGQRCPSAEHDGMRFVYGRFRQPSGGGGGGGGAGAGAGVGASAASGHERSTLSRLGGQYEEKEDEREFLPPDVLRSASEEALPVTVKREYSYERNLDSGHHEKTMKRQSCDYFPSPPSEDSYPDSYEDNSSFPAARSMSSDSRHDSSDQLYHSSSRHEHRDRHDRHQDSKGKAKQLPKSKPSVPRRGGNQYYS
uniref:Peptidase M12B domain-containing protein n=1 Tax=Strigamia maritima TaxID=126957 RepID=T1J8C7_STRMM